METTFIQDCLKMSAHLVSLNERCNITEINLGITSAVVKSINIYYKSASLTITPEISQTQRQGLIEFT